MSNVVIVGTQWGDEGKAKITNLLASFADIVIRYQGGCNSGHTVVSEGETYKFHLIPSGILYPEKVCIIGNGTVINPEVLTFEINDLIQKGFSLDNLKISPLAHLTLPYHLDMDEGNEKILGKNRIGTTKRGIGPTYIDKYARCGIRIEDLYDEETLHEKLDIILPQKNKQLERYYELDMYDKKDIIAYCNRYAQILEPYVCFEIPSILRKALQKDLSILFEGAQGTMLDIDFGSYPYVTSSNPIAGAAFTGSGLGPSCLDQVIGISKAYVTRVGEGPFATELNDIIGDRIQEIGNEYGTTTGRKRRCGWFDAVVARHSVLTNGLTGMVITKLDVFNNFEEIKICTSYKDNRTGKIYEDYPTNSNIHKYIDPIYESMDGWMEDISDVTTFEELPENAKNYIKRLEELTETPVIIVSTGPDKDQTIIIENPILEKNLEKV